MRLSANVPTVIRTIRDRVARGALGRALLFAFSVSACLLLSSGCKSMTEAKKAAIEEEEEQAARAELEQKQAEEAAKAADEEQKAFRRRAAEIELREERKKLRAEALIAVGTDPEEALKKVREIYDLPGKQETITRSDNTKETFEVEPPPLTDKEKAQLAVIIGTAYYNRGKEGDMERAVEAYRKATELDPELRQARRNFGMLLYADGKYREALDAFNSELAAGYQDAELLYYVAQALYEVFHAEERREPGQREAARIAMEKVLVERPEDEKVQRWLAYINLESGRYDEAIRLLEGIVDAHPFSAEYNKMLATAYQRKGDLEKALEQLEIAARLVPPDQKTCKDLAYLNEQQNLPEAAAIWLEKAYAKDPDKMPPEDHLYAGVLYQGAGRLEEARSHLEKVPESDPEYPDAQSRLAWIFEDLGQDEDALKAYENVVRARPQDGQAHLAAGDIYLARKDLEKALAAYAKAAALPDTKADGLAGLAEVAYDKRDLEGAVKHYQEALAEDPKNTRYLTALREINAQLEIRRRQSAVARETQATDDE